MKASVLDYDLPPELIAQRPAERRDASRLLVYERATGAVRHRTFADLPEEVGDVLVVVNDTRVVPARIRLERPRGEVLLVERLNGDVWEGLARPTRRLRPGRRYGDVELLEHLGEGRWRLRLYGEPAGEASLPPDIVEPLADPERYQTVYARESGSAAAPTARLPFPPQRPQRRAPSGPHRPLRHAWLRVLLRRRAADELPPAALDAPRPRHGLRRRGGDARAVPARDRGALPLLLLRRRHAGVVNVLAAG